jgi:phosphoglucomutase
MGINDTHIQQLVNSWLDNDFYEETRQEIQSLVDAGDEQALGKLLLNRIAFGTAGLRSRMASGYANMNPLIVVQTTQGLVSYLEQVYRDSGNLEEAKQRGVVIGCDGRYNSTLFSQLTSIVFMARGFTVYLYSHIVGTPFVVCYYSCLLLIVTIANSVY